MNVNFSVFIDKILSGEKRQTIRRASPKWENVGVESPLGKAYLDEPFLRDLIERDGFDNKSAFFNFFAKTYKNWTNTMFVIRWADFKETKDEQL